MCGRIFRRGVVIAFLVAMNAFSVASISVQADEEQAEPAVHRAAENEKATHVEEASADEGLGGNDSEPEKSADETTKPEKISEAERISRLQRSVERDKQQLEYLRAELKSAEEEFEQAGNVFKKVDEKLSVLKEKVKAAEEQGVPEKLTPLVDELTDRQGKWDLCKERFDLSLQSKKALQQQISALKEKIEQDDAALTKLSGPEEEEAPAKLPAEAEEKPAEVSPSAPMPVLSKEKSESQPDEPSSETKSEPPRKAPLSPLSIAQAGMTGDRKKGEALEKETAADVQEARSEADRQEAMAGEAREAVAAIEKRQQSLDRNIDLEQQLRDAARKQADNALHISQEFHEDYRTKSEANAPPEELIKIGQRIQSSEMRLEKARDEVKRRTERLDELQFQRHTLMSERISALEQAEASQQIAADARRKVQSLENPFSSRNLQRWMYRHAPNVMVIVIGFLALRLMVRVICRRVVVLMTHKGDGTRKERENRAETIVGVFHNAATVVCYSGSSLMILEECGVPVGPLLGGAAVVGLAVAFGSQNLIRDYFYGFVILLENQYGVNDVVQIGGITGNVERITLRMTVVRDMDGVNFIPNGRIESVKNLTHGWSRAVIDVAVSYKEDLDAVMELLLGLGQELRKDPQFADAILEDPTMLGVEQLGESAVTIKFFLKTKPLEQWQVRREMLRRIKRRFDELNIEIPSPQRTINHRYLAEEEPSVDEAATAKWRDRKSA